MKKSSDISNSRKSNNQRLIEVLGPVDNLESYVRADWWRHIFNANYLRTDGDVVNDETITAQEVQTFMSVLGVDKDTPILDLCCGQGRHVLEMARTGYWNVHGMDRSHYLVSRARNIARKSSLNISFREGDARKLPYRDNHFGVVTMLGNSFGYFETQQDDIQVLQEVRRVLRPGGHLILRLYVRPDRKESPDAVIDALLDGWTDNFNAFKLRLMMAMSPDPGYSVRVADIFDLWSSRGFDYNELSRRIGIPRATIEAMDNYRGSATCYNFPPNTYVADHFARHFDLIDSFMPAYTLGERCPTLLLARR